MGESGCNQCEVRTAGDRSRQVAGVAGRERSLEVVIPKRLGASVRLVEKSLGVVAGIFRTVLGF